MTEFHANQWHLCKTGQIYTESEYKLVWYKLRKGRKKEYSEKTDKDRTTDKNSTDNMGAYQITPTPVPHPNGGQPTPPPLPPPSWHLPTRRETQRSTHTQTLLGPHTASQSFSVLQPCGSHVALVMAVTPRPHCPWPRCPLFPQLTPHSAAGPMLLS